MTTFEEKVKTICDEIYKKDVQQILIDLVQEDVEVLINSEEPITRDAVGSASYKCSILMDVYSPKFDQDIDILDRLESALTDWSNDIENTNKLLGIPREK